MGNQRIEEIEQRLKKLTSGEWFYKESPDALLGVHGVYRRTKTGHTAVCHGSWDNPVVENEHKFIAAVRQDLPWLLDQLNQHAEARKAALNIAFICTACGGISHGELESLDSGATLTCDSCGKDTVIHLQSPGEYCKTVRQLAGGQGEK